MLGFMLYGCKGWLLKGVLLLLMIVLVLLGVSVKVL